VNRIGMSFEVRSIVLVSERRAALQRFQRLPFLGLSEADDERVSGL